MGIDWGIPDWLGPQAYGAVKSWNENRWRWEFTRRRGDYRADFDQRAAESYALAIEVCKNLDPGPDGKRVRPDQILKPTDPGFVATEYLPPKYGLPGLPNPRISNQPSHVLRFQRLSGIHFMVGDTHGDADAALAEGFVEVEFNLKLPIKPQLQGLQSHLESQQTLIQGQVIPCRRRHPKKWLTYLRVLDGHAAGASWRELAVVLPKHMRSNVRHEPQAAAQVWKAATALMFNWPD